MNTSHRPPDDPRPVAATPPRVVPARRILGGAAGGLAYILLVAFPLLVLLLGEMPKGGGYWWDFAMALGFGGLAMMALQSVLTARFRRATAPYGVDIIYYFHRLAALGGFALIAGHYIVLKVKYGEALGALNPLRAPWHMTAGRIALLLFGVLIVTSLWRKILRIEYDRWRLGHAILAVAAVILAMAHIYGVAHYTQAAWKGALWGGYTALWLLAVLYVRGLRPRTLLRSPYRVTAVQPERGRCWTLGIEPSGHAGLRFNPGQFAWLTIGASPFRAREHPFSFSGSANEPAKLRFTIKELGDFTRTIGNVKVGEIAYVDGPHGVFTSDYYPSAPGFVFIAGGVGIAPIMSMLRTLADRGESRALRLIFGNWRWDEVLFRDEIESLRERLQLDVKHVLQEPPAGWTGATGILSEPVVRAAIPDEARTFVFFLCGPQPMTDSVQTTLRAMGVPRKRIHCELFDMA